MNSELLALLNESAQGYKESEKRFKEISEMATFMCQKIKNSDNPKELWEQMFYDSYKVATALTRAGVSWDLTFSHKSAPHVSFVYKKGSGKFRVFYDNQKTGYCADMDRPFLLMFDADVRHPQDMHEDEITAAVRSIFFDWDSVLSETVKGIVKDLQERTTKNNAQIQEIESHMQKSSFFSLEKEDADREDR